MKRFILLLCIIVFTYLAMSACAVKTATTGTMVTKATTVETDEVCKIDMQNREFIVEIRPVPNATRKLIEVDPDLVCVKFGTNQSVRWVKVGFPSSNGPDFIVNLNKHSPPPQTPFYRSVFGPSNPNSGRAIVEPPPHGPGHEEKYDYLVVVPGYIPLDPGVLIWD